MVIKRTVYCLSNCRFIEKRENSRLGALENNHWRGKHLSIEHKMKISEAKKKPFKKCIICNNKHKAFGYCAHHYNTIKWAVESSKLNKPIRYYGYYQNLSTDFKKKLNA